MQAPPTAGSGKGTSNHSVNICRLLLLMRCLKIVRLMGEKDLSKLL